MNEQKVPSVGSWMITLFIMTIPIVNFVALIYWAASSSSNPVKANFAKAALIWIVNNIALYAMFFGALIGAFLGMSR
jgi:hypothetical protein